MRLTWSGETVLIEDCSTNGTLVNGQTIVDQIRIPWNGQPIDIRLGTRETMMLRNCERSSGADDQMTGSTSGEASALEPLATNAIPQLYPIFVVLFSSSHENMPRPQRLETGAHLRNRVRWTRIWRWVLAAFWLLQVGFAFRWSPFCLSFYWISAGL